MSDDIKHCRLCDRVLLLSDFYVWSGKPSSNCKECLRKRSKRNSLKNKELGIKPKPRRKFDSDEERAAARSVASKKWHAKKKENPNSPSELFKTCPRCGEMKTISEFTVRVYNKDGLANHCRACGYKAEEESRLKRLRERWWIVLLAGAKRHAKERGQEFNLTEEFILELFSRQNGRCFWFGIELVGTNEHKHPCKPSIDRIDRTKGYTEDNVVLSCYSANIGRNVASAEMFTEFVRLVKESPYGAHIIEQEKESG